jgi:hypothetical protein
LSTEPGQAPAAGPGIEATILLCDAAQQVGGKLYMLGAGWSSVLRVPGGRTNIALAVMLSVPWDMANRPFDIEARLITDEGTLASSEGEPVRQRGTVEVARGFGLPQGSPLPSSFVMDFGSLDLSPGGYVFEFRVEDTVKAQATFLVRDLQ